MRRRSVESLVTYCFTSHFSLSLQKSSESSQQLRWPTSWRQKCGAGTRTCSSSGDAEPWEQIKRRERHGSVLGGLVPTLPPLLMAVRLQERAASVGFDWPDVAGPLAKVQEELVEVENELAREALPAATHNRDPNSPGRLPADELTEEIGDLLFAAVNLARKAGVQAGPALDHANRKFRRRFEKIEELATQRGLDISAAGLEVLDGLWNEVKTVALRVEPMNLPGKGDGLANVRNPADPGDRALDAQSEA